MKYEIREEFRAGFKQKVKKRPRNHEAEKMFGQKDLMMALREKLGCTIQEARMMAQAVSASIVENLLNGVSVYITDVGSIGFKFRVSRTWNVKLSGKTGTKTAPNRLCLKFKPSNKLKENIRNAPFQEQVKNIKPHPLSP